MPISTSILLFLLIIAHFGIAQYYNAPMMTGSGCVATANKLYSHGVWIIDGKYFGQLNKFIQ
jgi:hypothetical protein